MGRKSKDATKKPRKLIVEFDVNARKEYITGMHKRKQQRRADAIEQLKKQVKAEKAAERKEQQKILLDRIEKSRALRDNTDINENEEEIDEDTAADNLVSTLAGASAKTTHEKMNDAFSKKMFGASSVTVTTTTVRDDDSEDEAPVKPKPSQFFGQKNVKVEMGQAEKMLRRLLEKNKGKKSSKLSSNARQGKRKKGKTGAKERRRRK